MIETYDILVWNEPEKRWVCLASDLVPALAKVKAKQWSDMFHRFFLVKRHSLNMGRY